MEGSTDIDPVAMRRKRQSMINALCDLSEGQSDVDEASSYLFVVV